MIYSVVGIVLAIYLLVTLSLDLPIDTTIISVTQLLASIVILLIVIPVILKRSRSTHRSKARFQLIGIWDNTFQAQIIRLIQQRRHIITDQSPDILVFQLRPENISLVNIIEVYRGARIVAVTANHSSLVQAAIHQSVPVVVVSKKARPQIIEQMIKVTITGGAKWPPTR